MAFEAPILLLIAFLILLILIPVLLGIVLVSLLALAWPILAALGIALLIGIAVGAVRFEAGRGDGYTLRIHVEDPLLLTVVFIAALVLVALLLAAPVLIGIHPPHHQPAWR